MAKGSRGPCRVASRQYSPTPYSLPSLNHCMSEDADPRKCCQVLDKKDWEDATCAVCMECPHNAVLLLCSSHDNGCRPYMCGTSFRYSNYLDLYKKAYTKMTSLIQVQSWPGSLENPILIPDSSLATEKCEVMELSCPLCRGEVKGWTVVEPARAFLNAKQRNCMQDDCSFVGNYKELRKHVKADHPSGRPREVDPLLEQKWRRIERERERNDVISTIRSTMPGAMVFGDYVVEGNQNGFDTDEEDGRYDSDSAERDGGFEVGFDSNLVNIVLLLHALGASGNDVNRRARHAGRALNRTSNENDAGMRLDFSDQHEDDDGNYDQEGMSLVSRLHHHGRELLNHSRRRRTHRGSNEDRGR